MIPSKPILFLCAAALFVGCNSENESKVAKRRSNLSKTAAGYRQYIEEKGKGPSGVEDFAEFMLAQASADQAIENAVTAIREGDVVVIWDGVFPENEDPDKYTLAFEASVPGSGGYLVTGGGTIQLVTVQQFTSQPTLPQAASDGG